MKRLFHMGGLVDLVCGPQGALELLTYHNGVANRQHSIADGGRMLLPPSVDRSLVEAIRWPLFVEGCELCEEFGLMVDSQGRKVRCIDLS